MSLFEIILENIKAHFELCLSFCPDLKCCRKLGPILKLSLYYMLTFNDDYSRFLWIYFFKGRSEVFEKFIEFKEKVVSNLWHPSRCLRIDNRG